MPINKLSLKATPEHKGQRLDQVLAVWLPQALSRPLSKAKIRKLIVAGAVYLNGRRVRIASKPIQLNARIDCYVDFKKLEDDGRAHDVPFVMDGGRILYEDEFLIAVDKPPGLPTQPTLDEARDNLFAAVKRFLAKRDGLAQPYLGLHHRLDRDTSGVVLFTKKVEANAGVAELFSKHQAIKTYNAVAHRPSRDPAQDPPENFTVQNYLGKAPGSGKRNRYTAVRSGGDFAHTDFKVLEKLSHALLIEATPKTGRTHQIRVHLAESGMPILGDATYGTGVNSSKDVPRLMLHAACLTFPHPINKTEVSIESPLPEDFAQCLQKLKR